MRGRTIFGPFARVCRAGHRSANGYKQVGGDQELAEALGDTLSDGRYRRAANMKVLMLPRDFAVV